jgi:hypothetical protein
VTSIQQRDAESVLTGIDELLPKLRERAQETEDLRRIPDATIAELDEVGFFKLLQPEQWGGLQSDPALFYEAVRRPASDQRHAKLARRLLEERLPVSFSSESRVFDREIWNLLSI